MKSKNYYEVLGVAPHVGSGQIQAAYRFARGLYAGESTSTYALLDAEEREQMLALVEEAYAALSNPSVRRDYDGHLGARAGRPVTVPPLEHARAAVAPPEHPPSALHPRTPVPATGVAADPIKVPEVVTGAVLKSLREGRNLSLDQIAGLSKVGSRFLKALEEDRHERLPGRVFARGFLIEYARAIGAVEAEIVDRYLRHWTPK